MAASTPIREFMTSTVQTVDMECSLQAAHELMAKHDIRHLPVLDEGKFLGVVSQRELEMLRAFPLLDLAVATVPDAMSEAPYVVPPDATLQSVVREMAAKKYGSVIIAEGDELLGIFTTIDALRVLDSTLDEA
jgi:acetoin utilization protein AcuB